MNKNKIISLLLTISIASSQVVPSFAVKNYKTTGTTNKIWNFAKEYGPSFLIGSGITIGVIKILDIINNKKATQENQKTLTEEIIEKEELITSEKEKASEKDGLDGIEFLKQEVLSTHEQLTDEIKENAKFQNIGVINVGNACYLNSVIQQLYRIDSFRNSILNANINEIEHPDFIIAIKAIFDNIALGRPVDRKILKNAALILRDDDRQNDYNEYFIRIFNNCNIELENFSNVLFENFSNNNLLTQNLIDNPVSFNEQLNSIDDTHKMLTIYKKIPTNISNNQIESDKINQFFGPDRNNIWNNVTKTTDDYCNVNSKIFIRRSETNENPILFLYMLFDNKLSFPTEIEDNGEQYSLTGATLFSGSQENGGHYYTLQKCSDDKWRLFNDSSVTEIKDYESIRNLIDSNSVSLMYTKVE